MSYAPTWKASEEGLRALFLKVGAEAMPAETVLQEAQRLVYGDRQAAYGHPYDDYTRTGRIFGAIIDGWLRQQPGFEHIPRVPDVPAHIGCLFMVGVKVSREVNEHKRDNCTDGAGYFGCVDMCAERQAKEG